MLEGVSRILLVRGDKIGDVTLITPAIRALRKKHPSARIVSLVQKNVADVLQFNPDIDRVFCFDPKVHKGFLGFFRLIKEIRQERFQVVVIFQAKLPLVVATAFARIPYRIGPLSKWWSWLFLNLGLRQNRSAVEMHEADYNLQLLYELGVSVAETEEYPFVMVSKELKEEAQLLVKNRGINPKYKLVAIHPGMAGSALNWPESHYIRLGRRLLQKYNIIVTGGPGEEELVERVIKGIAKVQTFDVELPVLTKYVGKADDRLAKFIAILDCCDGVVAPSTGPMHLAVALRKKVVTIFSPIHVQSAVRWGPYQVSSGSNLGVSPEDQVSTLVPDVNCGEHFKCALSACIYYPCMPRISVEDVETQLSVLLEGGEVSMFKSNYIPMDLDEDSGLEDY